MQRDDGSSIPDGEHRAVFELLPWHANGTLGREERERVERHLVTCDSCRDELALCREAGEAVWQTRDAHWEPPPGHLDRLREKLPPAEPRAARPTGSWIDRMRDTWSVLPGRVRFALAAQSALVAGLAALLVAQLATPEPRLYQTLTAPAPAAPTTGPRLLLAFEADTTEPELRALLSAVNGSIVQGPTALGVYTVALTAEARVDAAVETLRADPRVRLAEPLPAARP